MRINWDLVPIYFLYGIISLSIMEDKNDMEDQVDAKIGVDIPVEEPKKQANVPAIILSIVALLLAGAAGFFGYKYFVPDPKPEEEPKEETPVVSMAEEYNEVRDVVKALMGSFYDSLDWESSYRNTSVENGDGLFYKPDGINTHVPIKMTIQSRIRNYHDSTAFESDFENAGFSYIGILPHGGSAGPEIHGYYNDEKKIVCSIYADTNYVTLENREEFVELDCAKTSWSWLTEAEKELISGLEAGYREKTGEYPRVLDVLGSLIKDSQFAPYQTITVGVGGAAGLFYRTDKDAAWQFFTGTQDMIGCDRYNTENLKKAYLGEQCYDVENQTVRTVEL